MKMKQLMRMIVFCSMLAGVLSAGGLVTGKKVYRFTPGDKVLFANDFHDCPVGEFPEGFDKTNGAGECVKYNDRIWIAPSTDADFRVYKKIDLGQDDFSIEFDALIYQDISGAVGPKLRLSLLQSKGKDWDRDRLPYDLEVNGYYHRSGLWLEGVGKIGEIEGSYRKTRHVAIQVRRKQLRVYVDGKRLVSIPFATKPNEHVSGFELMWLEDTNAYGMLVTNIKVAKYTKKEARPTPEKLGIGVQKTQEGYLLSVPERVLFDFNKFILKPEAKKALASVGAFIREHPARRLIVAGYTDNIGGDAYNLRLSLQRAQSVADYLIDCEKIDPKLFRIEGKGKANPVADNSTEEGRAKNRRVEIRILK